MTATSARPQTPRRPGAGDVARLITVLESRFGTASTLEGSLVHQHLLDALDRGEMERFLIWPPVAESEGVLYYAPGGTLLVAGSSRAGAAMAEVAERTNWRVLLGDWDLGRGLLEAAPRRLLKRRASAREQRFMLATEPPTEDRGVLSAPGTHFRRATVEDIAVLTDFACRLHVEDRMGPPIPRAGRGPVRTRMLESLARSNTWVVEIQGELVAKVDVALRSLRRGAQIAGVYVDRAWRGQGLGGGAVSAMTSLLLAEGLPGVTLHVRADNAPAIAAYRHAGFRDTGPLMLALR